MINEHLSLDTSEGKVVEFSKVTFNSVYSTTFPQIKFDSLSQRGRVEE